MRKFASLAFVLGAFGVVAVGTAPASAEELCYAYVHPHTMPRPILPPQGVGVETGEYHMHQNCIIIGGGS